MKRCLQIPQAPKPNKLFPGGLMFWWAKEQASLTLITQGRSGVCLISRGSLRAMHHHHHRWPTWLVPGLYLIGLHVLGLYVTCTWLGFDLYLALLLYLIGLHVLGLYVTCTWLGFGLYLACMYLTCMWFVLGLYLACTPGMLTCHLSLLIQLRSSLSCLDHAPMCSLPSHPACCTTSPMPGDVCVWVQPIFVTSSSYWTSVLLFRCMGDNAGGIAFVKVSNQNKGTLHDSILSEAAWSTMTWRHLIISQKLHDLNGVHILPLASLSCNHQHCIERCKVIFWI